ncbi:hypothetical protein C8F04DRAFT_1061355 [Mycena alexandri]|uniref:BZIP domain-containing protein n=1 Tax=Mycena alexandri TaxID=1745969 RepID=A0AAD6TJB9_9AGAR|nr:hypothetical protein C8F04DRAFT_1061355 [Mycena alexandri]
MTTDIRDPSSSKWASSSLASAHASISYTTYSYEGQSHWQTSPMLSSTASDDYEEFEQPQLTLDCRRRPLSSVPSPTISPHTTPAVAISVPADNNTSTTRKDVHPVLNPAASFRPPSPAPRFNGFSNSPLESPLSSSSPDPNVAINNDNTRPRTLKVFNYNGLPQNLPPPPRPISHCAQSSKPPTNNLLSNYLTMLAHKPTDSTVVAAAPTVAPNDTGVHTAFADIERLTGIYPSLARRQPIAHPAATASPEFRSLGDSFPDDFESTSPAFTSAGDFNTSPAFSTYDDDFFTSPLMDDYGSTPLDTPLDAFLSTPGLQDLNDFDSPVIADTDDFSFDGMDLFGAASAMFEPDPVPKLPTQQLWTISPGTPALDAIEPASTLIPKTTPVIPPAPTTSTTTTGARRRSNVTGTRKNLKPEALIPLDAPTQKRNYITPSATSRKAVPDAFVKKRLHSVAFGGDEDDDEELPALSPTASEAETIEHKRRQNTLAARKSRKRKLEHQQMLEDEVQALQGEVTVWRERALMAQEMLRGAGVNFSFDNAQQQA